MDNASPKPPFYESRWFKGAAAVTALLAAVWALFALPKPGDVARDIASESPLPLSNTMIVLDSSAAMAKPFGDSTKMEAATQAIARLAATTVDAGLALRVTSGGCAGEGKMLVGPGASHNDDVREEVSDVALGGPSNVIGTVHRAVDEFTDERFRRSGSMRRIVVFMGGEDRCAEAAGLEVREALEGMGVKTTFRMYALDLSKRETAQMAEFTAAVHHYAKVEYWPVEEQEELDQATAREGKELDEGKVPAPPPPEVTAPEGESRTGRAGFQGIVAEEETEPTPEGETTEETKTGEEEGKPEGEGTEETTEESVEEQTTPTVPGVGAIEGPRLYAFSRTGNVFSWFRKADSVNLGLPATAIFG